MSDQQEENYLPLPKEKSGNRGSEALSSEVQKAQEQLLALQRQQEQIERQKRDLEELTRKEDEFENGKEEMVEKFTRALVIVERQTFETQKQLEQLRTTTKSFTDHLRTLESINPSTWSKSDLEKSVLQKELSKALSSLDQARSVYAESRSRISAELSEDVLEEVEQDGDAYGDGHGFGYWFMSGLAFTLPLLLLGIAALVLWLIQP